MSLIASHSELDLETVARLSAAADAVAPAVLSGQAPLRGSVVLATCNRFEIYAEAEAPGDIEAATDALLNTVAASSGLDPARVRRVMDTRTGVETARHLFSVGAGLDSAVIGEREIAGQVRRALIEAQDAGTASGGLTKLFQTASRTAKDVQSSTELGSRGKSIVSVALDLASDLDPTPWSQRRIVLFGTGAYAGATMALLRGRGASEVSVYSASGRAKAFVESRGGTALNEDTLEEALRRADVLIGCSGGSARLDADDLASLGRDGAPLVAIDLALSHDFDPALDEVDGVTLLTLESVRMAAPSEQAESLRLAKGIVDSATRDFARGQRQRQADAAIVTLRRHTQAVLESEIAKVRAQHGCTAAAEEVEFAMRRMVKQLLHIPTVRARELAEQGRIDDYTDALSALYGLDVAETVKAKGSRTSAPASVLVEGAADAAAGRGGACPIVRSDERSA